jgi:hypothetical protein
VCLCAVANVKIYEQLVVTIVRKKLKGAGNIFLFDDIQRCGNERILEVSACGCWELSNGNLYAGAANECSSDLGRVNAGFTDLVSCNSVTCNDLVLLFLLRQLWYPGAECGN